MSRTSISLLFVVAVLLCSAQEPVQSQCTNPFTKCKWIFLEGLTSPVDKKDYCYELFSMSCLTCWSRYCTPPGADQDCKENNLLPEKDRKCPNNCKLLCKGQSQIGKSQEATCDGGTDNFNPNGNVVWECVAKKS